MCDSDDEHYVTFGVPLDPLDEDNFTRKKPVTIEDQYAYDAQGRRRFHGAFTGGFSAGYFNTVGTRDGWRPQQFKSSRSSKAGNVIQRPEDFMDDEDTSQFGIAPKGIRTTSDYADHGQRGVKRERVSQTNDGPIPGTPVLKELLKPVRETVGIILLKKMGWKPGQGVGSRITQKEKAKIKKRNERIRVSQFRNVEPNSSADDSEEDFGDVTFAPDDYEPFRCNPKDNFFGIGYSGLDRRNVLSGHVNLFDAPAFSIKDKNKKLSIHGQAFGVGAFEADDDDIYEREDMSRYDFALGPEQKIKSRWSDDKSSKNSNCLEGFVPASNKLDSKKFFKPPELPKDFIPVHAVRKSRFYPPIENVSRTLTNGNRKDLTAVDRARILDDSQTHKPSEVHSITSSSVASSIITRTLNLHGRQQTEERQRLENQHSNASASWMDKLNATNFVKGGIVGLIDDSSGSLKTLEEVKSSGSMLEKVETRTDADKIKDRTATAKPFLLDPDKQRRFEQYLEFIKAGEGSKFESIQPLSMTEWDREHERTEFDQAAKLFEQSNVSDTSRLAEPSESTNIALPPEKCSLDDEMRQAVKMKMFGKLTRERMEWIPASIVCKRFNIPEPKAGCSNPEIQKRAAKFSILGSVNWNNDMKFSKATDAVPPETNDLSILPKREDDPNASTSEMSDSITSFSNHRDSEHVSEKMRNFEASYEKIFGKGVQETPTAVKSAAQQNFGNVADNKTNLMQEIQPTAQTSAEEQYAGLSKIASKNKSEEKKDLFKAIFLSSSEDSESESEEIVDSEAVKSVLIGKAASEINVQRNTSPSRGIFANLDLDSLIVDTKRNEAENQSLSGEEKESNTLLDSTSPLGVNQNSLDKDSATAVSSVLPEMYGPVLPARLLKNESTSAEVASSSQNIKPVFRSVVVPIVTTDSKSSGKWVEREKLKKSKKEKKKHKHKEHKSSKHKHKSKKDKR